MDNYEFDISGMVPNEVTAPVNTRFYQVNGYDIGLMSVFNRPDPEDELDWHYVYTEKNEEAEFSIENSIKFSGVSGNKHILPVTDGEGGTIYCNGKFRLLI